MTKRTLHLRHCPARLVAARERDCWVCGEPMIGGALLMGPHVGRRSERDEARPHAEEVAA